MNKLKIKDKQCKEVPLLTVQTPKLREVPLDVKKKLEAGSKQKKIAIERMYKMVRKAKETSGSKEVPIAVKSATVSCFREFSEKCPSTEMSRFLEKRIRQRIQAKGLEAKYPKLITEMIEDTKQEFVKIVHYAGMNLKIKSCYPEAKFKVEPYKFLGRTESYNNFLRTMKHFRAKWILHYPVVRRIHKECVDSLPYELVEIKFQKALELSDVKYILKDKAHFATQQVYEFYNKIEAIVESEASKNAKVLNVDYLSACTGLLSVHVSRCIAHTLLYVVNSFSVKDTIPFLILNVSFDDGLVLTPTSGEVIEVLHGFLDKILTVGGEVFVLERRKGKTKFEKRPVNLCITDEFLRKCREDIENSITTLYKPIMAYLEQLSEKFENVYKDIDSTGFLDSINDIEFDEGCKKIHSFRTYLENVLYIQDQEFFQIGKIVLKDYRRNIHDGLKNNITKIFGKLSSQHLWEVADLNDTFQMITTRATEKPTTTEELMETGKFMALVRNEQLQDLNLRVENSIVTLCKIIDLGELTPEHIDLNLKVVKWLEDIHPILDEHSATYEQLKFDAEDKLQKVVEDVNDYIQDIYPLLVMLDDMDDIGKVRSYLHQFSGLMIKIKDIQKHIDWINKEEVCLAFPKSTYVEYEDLKNHIFPFYHILNLCLDVQRNLYTWQDGPFEKLVYETTNKAVHHFHKELTELHKSYRKKLRQAQDENLPLKFKGTVDDPDILNWPAPLKLCGTALRRIEEFLPSVEVTKIICNPFLKKRHWDAMSQIAGESVLPNAGSTLRKMMMVDFKSKMREYEIISEGATKEKQLFDHLKQLSAQWDEIRFTMDLDTRNNIKMLVELHEIYEMIDDHMIEVQNMKVSVFVKPYEEEVKLFRRRILTLKETIDYWSKVQQNLLELSPMFSKADLSTIIPDETKIFTKVSTTYDSYAKTIDENSLVVKVMETTDIPSGIKRALRNLEIVRHGVVKYLNEMRRYFPRFYFISNKELYEVISNTGQAIEERCFLNKVFQAVYKLHQTDGKISGVLNSESELVGFEKVLAIDDVPVDKLCSNIQTELQGLIKNQMIDCYKRFKHYDIKELLQHYALQVVLVITQLYWQESVVTALALKHNIKLRLCYQKLNDKITSLVAMTKSLNASRLESLKLKSVIINELNNKTLLDVIFDSGQINSSNFDWECALKYRFENQECHVRSMHTETPYRLEYLGNFRPLVCTPMTDRFCRALINAHYFHFSGLIEGAHGAGKSDTMKNLAAALGVFFVSINCPKEMKSSTLRRLVKGNASCCSWICLENFAVLSKETISVFAQDILTVRLALESNADKCVIDGDLVKLDRHCFLTISTTKIVYESLPDNFKALFRVVSMTKPDLGKIAEVNLCSIGFRSASTLSKKIGFIFNTCKDLFSSYYSFDIAHLKQLICRCDEMKTANIRDDEEYILYSSLTEIFYPQMNQSDAETFESILSGLFQNKKYATKDHEAMTVLIHDICHQTHLEVTESLIAKAIETCEAVKVSRKLILVGDIYSGKTTNIQLCQNLITRRDQVTINRNVINPNYLDHRKLIGYTYGANREWIDGIITKFIRGFTQTSLDWLIFDGNIDEVWIENIAPILQENKRLYLKSGESLFYPDSYTTIFEVLNLNNCSPPIVSQCAVIYLESTNVGWSPLIKSWAQSVKSLWMEIYSQQTLSLMNWIVTPCLIYLKHHCTVLCFLHENDLVKNFLVLTQMTLDNVVQGGISKEDETKNLQAWIQGTLIQAGSMAFGATLDTMSRQKFDEFYRILWKGQNEDFPYPDSLEKLDISIPADGLIYDHQFLYKQRGAWKLHQDLLKAEVITESAYMSEILVPTVDTLRYNNIFSMLIKNKRKFVLMGPPGTGKSILMENLFINKMSKDKYETSQMTFNVSLSAEQVQTFIISKLNKRRSSVYSPPAGKNFVLFVDNLNYTTANKYGSFECLELLRQYIDHEVWYDIRTCEPTKIYNVNLVLASGLFPKNEERLRRRFLRHFHVFCMNEVSDDVITRLYTNGLLYMWRKASFPSDVATSVGQIVEATMDLYNKIRKQCKASINRCYYGYNLDDFSKVIQGCSLLRKETYDANKKIYIKLWAHEALRVFGDKLSSLDQNWLQTKVLENCVNNFNTADDDTFDGSTLLNDLMFSTINDCQTHPLRRKYEEIVDQKQLVDLIATSLDEYNDCNTTKMDLVLFSYAVDKLVKICRVLSFPSGNALFLTPTGSGSRSLTKLSAFIYKHSVFQPLITQAYNNEDWNDDVKRVLKEAGGKEKETVFLVGEKELVNESFLHNIDFLLQNKEIPGLYNDDEKQDILEIARLSAQVLCLDPLKEVFRRRVRNYPSLMKCHIILWEDWPDEAFKCISTSMIESVNLPEETKVKIPSFALYAHRDYQNITKKLMHIEKSQQHVSSIHFIHVHKLFSELIFKRNSEIYLKKNKYLEGLSKLSAAADQILNMQKALAEYTPQLEAMTRQAAEMTEEIALETTSVEKASALVREDEKTASEQAIVAQTLKLECESELAQAIPILEDAISALNTLKPSDITLVKSMKNPPDAIKLVMAAVCVIKDVKPERIPDPSTGRKTIDYWGPSKRILGDMNFLQTLKDFDKDHIKPEIMVKIRKDYLPHKDFNPRIVAKASSAAEGLCKWIIAMDMYDKVAKEVAPKKEKLERAEREYADTMAVLNEKKDEVKRIEQKLKSLNETLEEATKKQVKLQKEVDICNRKLGSAQKLIGSLSGEKDRWTHSVTSLEEQMDLLSGNMLLVSCIVAYLGNQDKKSRAETINRWHKVLNESGLACSADPSEITLIFSDPYKETWQEHGLPDDSYLIQNIVITKLSKHQCLIIDPDYQADNWIQEQERPNKLIITDFSDKAYLTLLSDGISKGKPILINQIKDRLPVCLSNLIFRNVYIVNNEWFIKLGAEVIRYDANFRLYLVSNLRAPQFVGDVAERINKVNFSITHQGLTDKLLNIIAEAEKPELKRIKRKQYIINTENKRDLEDLEDKILRTLCESGTEILEDEAAIKVLDQSKDLVKIVRERQEEYLRIEKTMKEFADGFMSAANFASNLYDCIIKLQKVNYTYQFSLEWYMYLYRRSIIDSEKTKVVKRKCDAVISINVLTYRETVSIEEVLFFLKTDFVEEYPDTNPAPEGMDPLSWRKLQKLKNLQSFREIPQCMLESLISKHPLYNDTTISLSGFQKLILTHLFRPEDTVSAVEAFIRQEIGEQYLQYTPININDVYNNSYSLSPILILLTPGSMSFNKIYSLASQRHYFYKFNWLSFGDTETETADELIERSQKDGLWLLLENCHLVPEWLKVLEKRLIAMDCENTHENFRLWLTAEPTVEVPLEILQICNKLIINDNPEGIKKNMEKLYKNEPIVDMKFYNSCPGKHDIFTKYVYAVTLLHSSLKERSQFRKLSWTTPYQFDQSDLNIALLQTMKTISSDIFSFADISKLQYMISYCHYGMYIDNELDIRIITALVQEYLNTDVTNSSFQFNGIQEYGLPRKCHYEDYVKQIAVLPSTDNPEIYGINSFVNKALLKQSSKAFLKRLCEIYEEPTKIDFAEKEFALLTIINELSSNLPSNIQSRANKYVAVKEFDSYNKLLDEILNSLRHLKLSVDGGTAFTAADEDVAEGLLLNQVPRLWKRYSNRKCSTLSEYTKGLTHRMSFFEDIKDTQNNFWLGAFFYPRAFICNAKICIARNSKITLEDVRFEYQIVVPGHLLDEERIVLDNLYISGAQWDTMGNRISDCVDSIYSRFPAVTLQVKNESSSSNNCYICPLYHSTSLNDLVDVVKIPTEHSNHWTKRGVKLIANIETFTQRWALLQEKTTLFTLKPLSDSRWESGVDTIKALKYQIGEIYDALIEMDNLSYGAGVRYEATF
nr:unnamed protein product [Callosobruchus analis]